MFLTKNVRKTFKFEFALLTGFLTGFVVIFMGIYTYYFMQNISSTAEKQNNKINQSLATIVYETAISEIDRGTAQYVGRKIQDLIKNKLIVYTVIKNTKTGINEFSTVVELRGNDMVPNDKNIRDKSNPYSFIENRPTYNISKDYLDYKIYVGFYKNSELMTYLHTFKKYLSALVAAFILFGLFMSNFMSKIVIKPINMLVESSEKLAQGDLSHRIKESQYYEINKLIASYNIMASNLEQLYNSLENKVAKRTIELNKTIEELKQTQAMMVHSEKMKSLGELVAGITHEINNPINFIYGNLVYLKEYVEQLFCLIDKFKSCENQIKEEDLQKIKDYEKEIDFEFLRSDFPDLLKSCQEGTERTKNIIMDLKNFSRLDEAVFTNVNLPKEIDTTLNILHNKFKNKIEIHKDFEENFPQIEAYGGQLNQVLMNILDNAISAIKEKGNIWIRLKAFPELNIVKIEIQDDGYGMDETTKEKIFNPFFTTKPVGEGTGLGMSISYKVIKNHNGSIKVDSKVGVGSLFIISLPINQAKSVTK